MDLKSAKNNSNIAASNGIHLSGEVSKKLLQNDNLQVLGKTKVLDNGFSADISNRGIELVTIATRIRRRAKRRGKRACVL